MYVNFPPDMDPLERAMVEAQLAVDSRGLKIMLISPRNQGLESIAIAAMATIHRLSVDGVALGTSDFWRDELNRAHNIQLAANVLLQARIKQSKRDHDKLGIPA
jgi:hypothetical protein